MGLETSVVTINDLNAAWPLGGSDQKKEGDDHLRAIKAAVKGSFPNMRNAAFTVESKTSGLTAAASDNWKVWRYTGGGSGTLTIAPATVGTNFVLFVRNVGTEDAVLTVSDGTNTVGHLRHNDSGIFFSNGTVLVPMIIPAASRGQGISAVFDGSAVGTNNPMTGLGDITCTRNGVGDYTFTMSTAMPDDFYVPIVTPARSGTNNIFININPSRSFNVTTFSVICVDAAGTARDAFRLYVRVFPSVEL